MQIEDKLITELEQWDKLSDEALVSFEWLLSDYCKYCNQSTNRSSGNCRCNYKVKGAKRIVQNNDIYS